MKSPIAKKITTTLHHQRQDDYYWLNERDSTDVLDYLKAENSYTDHHLNPTKRLQTTLFNEIKGRIKKKDRSCPFLDHGYYYYHRFDTSSEHPIYCRRKGSMRGNEQVLLDGNKLSEGKAFMDISTVNCNHNDTLMAYGVDDKGRRLYTLFFKDLKTNALLKDTLVDTTGYIAWANDNQHLFYTKQDKKTLRNNKIYRHRLGTPQKEDVCVFEEIDESFSTGIYTTLSRRFIMIHSGSTISDEYRFLDCDNPLGVFTVFQNRQDHLEYSVHHNQDDFFIITNKDAENFRLMKTTLSHTSQEHWEEVVAHRKDVLLEDIFIFDHYMVLNERHDGLLKCRVIHRDGSEDYYLPVQEDCYCCYIGINKDESAHTLRFNYTSLTTPISVYSFNFKTKDITLLKQQPVLGGFSKENYDTTRLVAKASDGTSIPISVVYRKDKHHKNMPFLLYGYGSYGHSLDPMFSSARLSLLDRGIGYAIAHCRGGEEMGRAWYENGKLLSKKNTFTDFIACAEHLIDTNWTSADTLSAYGGSAGGLLIGSVINMRPDLFKAVVAAVPFVDVVTTMLDESIPLTTGEFNEWGNPKEKDYYDYILSYSPYDNVAQQAYPNILVTTGYHDSQVQYWEPAKWVAKLRELKTDKNLLLLHTDLDTGHGGQTGRFSAHKETAMIYGFVIFCLLSDK